MRCWNVTVAFDSAARGGADGRREAARVRERVDGRLQRVGLGHVQDTRELMSESNSGQLDFGPGDREGLARLGSDDC